MVISISGGWGRKPEAAPAEPLKNKKCEGCLALSTNCKTWSGRHKVWRIIITRSWALLVIPCAFWGMIYCILC